MPALIPTEHTATVTYLGHVPDRGAALASAPLRRVEAGWGGVETESHAGLTRPSDSRVLAQYERGTEIRNVRQFSIVSAENLAQIAQNMGVAELRPEWLGASICIEGIADFSHVPPSARLQNAGGTTLTIDMQNRPCTLPAPVIAQHFPDQAKLFKSAAVGLRGVTAWVERPGLIALGDVFTLHIPDQRAWAP